MIRLNKNLFGGGTARSEKKHRASGADPKIQGHSGPGFACLTYDKPSGDKTV